MFRGMAINFVNASEIAVLECRWKDSTLWDSALLISTNILGSRGNWGPCFNKLGFSRRTCWKSIERGLENYLTCRPSRVGVIWQKQSLELQSCNPVYRFGEAIFPSVGSDWSCHADHERGWYRSCSFQLWPSATCLALTFPILYIVLLAIQPHHSSPLLPVGNGG